RFLPDPLRGLVGRSPKDRDAEKPWNSLLEQLQPFSAEFYCGPAGPRDVSARPREAHDEPFLDRVDERWGYDGDGLGRASRGLVGSRHGHDDVDLEINQLRC